MDLDRKWLIILFSLLIGVHCRPQHTNNNVVLPLELQNDKIEIKEPKIDLKKLEANTHEIIEKIAEVNKKHGLDLKIPKQNVSQSSSSEPRSQENVNIQEIPRSGFKFPTNPFSNPILEFLEKEKEENQQNSDLPYPTTYEITNRQSQDMIPSQGYEITSTNHNAEISEEDIIPGQQVKRKIVHQQTILIPNPNYGLHNSQGYQFPSQFQTNFPSLHKYNSEVVSGDKKYLSSLEKQTISNIRNIISNSQLSQNQAFSPYYNPYLQVPGNTQSQNTYGYVMPIKNVLGQELPSPYPQITENSQSQNSFGYIVPIKNTPDQEASGPIGQISSNGNNFNVYGPFQANRPETPRQNWNWPGADFFPIFIKDPFLQMYNAITTMVEYGPNAGSQNPLCPTGSRNPAQRVKIDNLLREAKTTDQDTKISVELDGKNQSPQISINADNRNGTYLDIENIDIGAYGDNSLKFTLNLKQEEREVKEDIGTGRTSWDKIKVAGKSNSLVLNPSLNSSSRFSSKFSDFQRDVRPISVVKNQIQQKPSTSAILSPPNRDPSHHTEEFDNESEEEKSEEVISNDNNKKLFSRDNTGSGVFIHRLKVRKGGVAIAGPGGIATAGSGGTAIVGPGGVAYTQPDSLAIAGSGTKVIAVDPTINLGDIINNTSLLNRTRIDPAFPPSRFGKVVAVGPVVYYNKG